MSDNITVRGYVATDVRVSVASSGLAIASFRMCSTERRFDRSTNAWVDGNTNWYTVSMFRQLATNAGASIKKGDRVVVSGRLRVRPWINEEGKTGTNVEIDADTVGHDLMWGTANFRRMSPKPEDAAPVQAGSDVPDNVNPVTGEFINSPAQVDAPQAGEPSPDHAEEQAGGKQLEDANMAPF